MASINKSFFIQNNEQTICSGFLFWYKQTPASIALYVEGKSYTYNELYIAASSIYTELKNYGKAEVGVYCSNNFFSYASILAVSMSGACYVPLNAKFPEKKIKDIISDCNLELVISETPLQQLSLVQRIKNVSPEISNEDKEIEIIPFVYQSLAYILYTSGSTGLPKGVPVKKNSVNSFFKFFIEKYDFIPADKFLQAYELSFDVSVFSMFCAWNAGASVYTVNDGANKFLDIFKAIQKHKITVCSMVPGILAVMSKYFKDFDFPFVRYSFFSGDALYQSLAKKWKQCIPTAHLHNFYGPTETTIVCTRYKWEEDKGEKESVNDIVPIGKPFPGMEYVIINEKGIILTNGETGELCFAGIQVIDTYCNGTSPESFFMHSGKRFYKTGDWAKVNEQGNLIFLGRKDSQVKINGYRVELAEVENGIRIVFARQSKVIIERVGDWNHLVAFVEGEIIKREEFLFQLKAVIPDHMLPSKLIFVVKLPLTMNNKIDVQKLRSIINA
ncbi:MAG: AMP-binding protein [Bacteroidota bacterium]|nr:AMP-binding protein [Bacteroidota bacterium]